MFFRGLELYLLKIPGDLVSPVYLRDEINEGRHLVGICLEATSSKSCHVRRDVSVEVCCFFICLVLT